MISEIEHRLGSTAYSDIQHSPQAFLCTHNKEIWELSDNQKSCLIHLVLNDESYMLLERKRCPFIEEFYVSFDKEEKCKVLFSPSGNQLRFIVNGTKVTVDYDPAAKEIHSLLSTITKGI